MDIVDVHCRTPEEHLACDEALLDVCEEMGGREALRFWESGAHFVVLGYSNAAKTEVHLNACREREIPVLRRCSGGGCVVQGPGCLNYSLILSTATRAAAATITGTTAEVLRRHREALQPFVAEPIAASGQSDLTIGDRKFSGNAQRRKVRSVLFHGTVLYNFDLALIDVLLPLPSRQPQYRARRSHAAFLTNLRLDAHTLRRCIGDAWEADSEVTLDIGPRIAELVRDRYSTAAWTFRR